METEKPSFFVDAMLGNIAKKLRFLGYDSNYSSSIPDVKLIEEAKKDRRIIVTKDEGLAKSAKKQKLPLVLITKNEEVEQILEIFKELKISKGEIHSSTSRCPLCNGVTEQIEKHRISDKVPKEIFDRNKVFWLCHDCKKIYWQGSHIDNLQQIVLRLNEKL